VLGLLGSLSLESCAGLTTDALKPRISVAPSSITFGSVMLGATNTQSLTVSNPGGGNLIISGATVTGTSFNVSGLSVPLMVAPGRSMTFAVSFTPSTAGSVTGSLSLLSNAPTPPLTIGLGGTGMTSDLQLSVNPSTVSFGDVIVGGSSTKNITLANTGNGDVTVSRVIITGVSLTETGLTLPLTLSARQSANFNVVFAPSSVGALAGSITVMSSASNSPATIPLSGAGVSTALQLSANPSTLNFGNVAVGSTGTQTVTLSNTGNSNVTVSQIDLTGAASFSVTGLALPVTLSAGQTSSLNVVFAPQATGDVLGTISAISTASNSPSTVSLTGSGTQATSHSVLLSWEASRSRVEGYYVYRSTQPGSAYGRLNPVPAATLSYTDTAVSGGQTYFYVVSAVANDEQEEESEFSEEASVTIPLP